MLTPEERTEVKTALLKFILRVAENKNAQSAEISVLPTIVQVLQSL